MAKHNITYLYGLLTAPPSIHIDNDTGEYKKGICHLAIIRPERDFGVPRAEDQTVFDKPMIYSADPEIIKEMATWQENDLIWIKGVITTLDIQKVTVCSECGQKNRQPGEFNFVTPIYAERRFKELTYDEAVNNLRSHKEVSNQVLLIGYLCDDPKTKSFGNKITTAYQVAANRKFFLKSDDPVNKTDYPHIRSYGERAKQDALCLKKGSLVFVDGLINTRSFPKNRTCEHCGAEYQWNDTSMEIISFDTEFLSNYTTMEEIRQKEEEELERTKAEIFGA